MFVSVDTYIHLNTPCRGPRGYLSEVVEDRQPPGFLRAPEPTPEVLDTSDVIPVPDDPYELLDYQQSLALATRDYQLPVTLEDKR